MILNFSRRTNTLTTSSSLASEVSTSSSGSSSPSTAVSSDEFTPKRSRVQETATTPVSLSKNILKKLGPAADRLNLSGSQLTGIVAAITNHSGGNIDNISLSKSTARRHRSKARGESSLSIKSSFTCDVGQVNFDSKLLSGLKGYGKVNRLAVLLVQVSWQFLRSVTESELLSYINSSNKCLLIQELENKILCIAKTKNSTGKVEAETVLKALEDWNVKDSIIAMGFDTMSFNTGIHKGGCTILQQLMHRQV